MHSLLIAFKKKSSIRLRGQVREGYPIMIRLRCRFCFARSPLCIRSPRPIKIGQGHGAHINLRLCWILIHRSLGDGVRTVFRARGAVLVGGQGNDADAAADGELPAPARHDDRAGGGGAAEAPGRAQARGPSSSRRSSPVRSRRLPSSSSQHLYNRSTSFT